MANVNEIKIKGRAVADANKKYTKSGKEVTELRIAHNTRYQDKATQEWKDGKTEWFNIIAWAEKAHTLSLFKKGDEILVLGRLSSREYKKKDGTNGFSLEITANEMAKVDRKSFGVPKPSAHFEENEIPF